MCAAVLVLIAAGVLLFNQLEILDGAAAVGPHGSLSSALLLLLAGLPVELTPRGSLIETA